MKLILQDENGVELCHVDHVEAGILTRLANGKVWYGLTPEMRQTVHNQILAAASVEIPMPLTKKTTDSHLYFDNVLKFPNP